MKRVLLLAILTFLTIPVFCFSHTIHVPVDQPTIQAGIDAAVNGDTVLVAPGTYFENVDFRGRAITLLSSHGPEVTVIDAGIAGSAVRFMRNEGVDSVLDGFKLTNGVGTLYEYYPGHWQTCGGGIYCERVTPTIKNNIIAGNSAGMGGGIHCLCASPKILNNTISGNVAAGSGGGIGCSDGAAPLIRDNFISQNTAMIGGGVGCNKSAMTILKCEITKNTATTLGGGIASTTESSPRILNNIITENHANDASPYYTGGGGVFIGWGEDELAILVNNIIYKNSAENGGGIYFFKSRQRFMNNIVFENHAEDSGGGIRLEYSELARLNNNTVTGNSAGYAGGGVCCENYIGNSSFWNSIVWDNHSSGIGDEICVKGENFPPEISFYFSDVDQGPGAIEVLCGYLYFGPGMIEEDPLFVDAESHDFHLMYESPCRDTGHNYILKEPMDFEGDDRMANGIVDIGADEYHPHFYCTGNFTPGGAMEGKFIGLPDTWPTGIFIGSGVMDPPLQHTWGEFYLESPWFFYPLVPIPANGVLVIPETLPLTAAPYDIPMQAMIGWELTNLFVLEVR